MSNLLLTQPDIYCPIELPPAAENTPFIEPIMASSLDYGFDFDADELASELLTTAPRRNLDQSTQTVGAEEFESLYQWFGA
jgi:hypothetical protein